MPTIAPDKVRLMPRPRLVVRRQFIDIELKGQDPFIMHEGDQKLSLVFVMPTFEFIVSGGFPQIERKDRDGEKNPNHVATTLAWARWALDFCLMMAKETDMLNAGGFYINYEMAVAVESNYAKVIGPHERPWKPDWVPRL